MKKYEIVGNILGFKDTKNVEISEVNEQFSTMTDLDNKGISFTMVNPYSLREYSFDVTNEERDALGMTEESKISVHNIVVLQEPIENSAVNFTAPILVNTDNNRVMQIILDPTRHPESGMAETIKSFKL